MHFAKAQALEKSVTHHVRTAPGSVEERTRRENFKRSRVAALEEYSKATQFAEAAAKEDPGLSQFAEVMGHLGWMSQHVDNEIAIVAQECARELQARADELKDE